MALAEVGDYDGAAGIQRGVIAAAEKAGLSTSVHRMNAPEYGMVWEFSGRNAIQGDFHFEA